MNCGALKVVQTAGVTEHSLKVVHEQKIVPRWKRKLHERIGDVFALAHLRLLEVERQHSEVLADDPDGVDARRVALLGCHQPLLLVRVRVDFVHRRKRDVIAAQKVILLVRNDFLKQIVVERVMR